MGVLCAVLGVAAYAAQIAAGRLFILWYLPASAILGAILVASASTRADGGAFTDRDLGGKQTTIVAFCRGR